MQRTWQRGQQGIGVQQSRDGKTVWTGAMPEARVEMSPENASRYPTLNVIRNTLQYLDCDNICTLAAYVEDVSIA